MHIGFYRVWSLGIKLIIFILLIVSSLYAQNTDSLKLVLENNSDAASQAVILRQLSRQALAMHAYRDASAYLAREAEAYKEAGDSIGWANAHYNLGMVHAKLRNFDKAVLHSLNALDYFNRHFMISEAANSAINLGVIYKEKRQTDLALYYYTQAMNIMKELASRQDLEASSLNLGIADEAVSAETEGMSSPGRQWKMNQFQMVVIYSALGELYFEKGELAPAESFLNQALESSRLLKNMHYEAAALIQLGEVYFARGKNVEAYQSLEGGLHIARLADQRELALSAYSKLARITMALKQPAIAYTYLEKYIGLRDSLYNEQQLMMLNQPQQNLLNAQQQNESEKLLRENLNQSAQLEQISQLKMVLIGSFALIVVLLVIIILQYIHKSRLVKEPLTHAGSEGTQNSELKQLIETKDRFLSIIAHDLKNPFTSLLGFVDLAYTEFDDISDAEKRSYLGIIRQSSQHIYALLENLLTWSRAQSGRIEFKPIPVDLAEIVESSIDVVRSSAENKQIALYTDIPEKITVVADKNMLFTVLRNLLSNAIKFTGNGGSVTVSCRGRNKKAYISVTDTGVGMNADELSRLFRLDGNLKNTGTDSETGTGLGLILCQEFMSIHKSVITAESTPGKGSTFTFALDLAK
ncbi:hypothetical protein MASR1M74_27820 [Lentimicrobium sp.]